MSLSIETIDPPSGLKIYFSGPPLDKGRLPALFYFALSGEDSLSLPPFNQPASDLIHESIRVFSFSLPYHGHGYDNKKAMEAWIHAFQKHPRFLNNFLVKALENVRFLIDSGWADPKKIAAAGLSRGGLVAAHLAALSPDIKTILGYAPLTDIGYLTEFQPLREIQEVQNLNLDAILEPLIEKNLRFYIGNRDERVGTDRCYQFIRNLADRSYESGRRTANVELIITASVGHKGHGTLPHIFKDGTDWIKRIILMTN